GKDLTGKRPHALARNGVCHVPEGRGVFPTLTVKENILIQAAGGDLDEAVERAVTAFPILGEKLRQLAGSLSGGQQQMLALVVVDEIFEFLGRRAEDGRALLLVEQYVSRALELADYVYLMNRGRIEFAGEPGELDSDRLVAQYLGAHT